MEYTVYVYSSKSPATELKPYRCNTCGRPLFRHNSKRIVMSNAYGLGLEDLPPGSNYIEKMCHSCKSVYKILFQ